MEDRQVRRKFAEKRTTEGRTGCARDFLWGFRHPMLLDPRFFKGSLHRPFRVGVVPKNIIEIYMVQHFLYDNIPFQENTRYTIQGLRKLPYHV